MDSATQDFFRDPVATIEKLRVAGSDRRRRHRNWPSASWRIARRSPCAGTMATLSDSGGGCRPSSARLRQIYSRWTNLIIADCGISSTKLSAVAPFSRSSPASML